MPVDPFSLVHIQGSGQLYLPNSEVVRRQEALIKSRKISAGRIFSDYRHTQSGMGPGLDKPYEGLPFTMLRQLADTSPIDRVCIDTRMFQMRHVARRSLGQRDIGFAVRHVNHGNPGHKTPEGMETLCREIEKILTSPTAPFHSTIRDFLTMAVEEELTIDRKAMVITRDRRGRPIRFHLVDGATVKPVTTVVFEAIQKEFRARGVDRILSHQDYDDTLYRLSVSSGLPLYDAAYVQMIDAQPVACWKAEEMSIDIVNPTVRVNWWGYGRSVLEKSWRTSDAFLKAWNYNIDLFRTNYPEGILGVKGDYDEEGLDAWKKKVLGEGNGADNPWRMAVIPMPNEDDGIEFFKTRDTPKDMMFQEFLESLVRLKTASYRMHPSMVNFSVDKAAGTINFGSADQEQQIAMSQEEGFKSLLDSIADWLTRTIVKEYDEDLCMVWVGLDQESEDALVERRVQRVQNYITIDEARAEEGLSPLPEGIPENPGDFIGNYDQALQILAGQQAQQQQQMQMGGAGYDDGDFGDDQGQADQGAGAQDAPQMPPGGNVPKGQPQPAHQGAPAAPQPQFGGAQHPEEESDVLRRSLSPRRLMRIEVTEE